ncbi:MAG: hypothetical protein ACRDTD_33015, partial [Pseudonocardiaceae bacterium]
AGPPHLLPGSQRFGARALDLPYLLPALGPLTARVPHFLLMTLAADPQAHADRTHIDGGPVAGFLQEYFAESEGAPPGGDPVSKRLPAACRAVGGVPLLPLHELPAGGANP